MTAPVTRPGARQVAAATQVRRAFLRWVRARLAPAGQAGMHQQVPDRWLPMARITWLSLALLVIAIHIARFPLRSALLLVIAPVYAPGLSSLGLSTPAFRALVNGLEIVTMLAYIVTGLITFLRRSDQWMALLGGLALIAFGAMPTFLRYGPRVYGMWSTADAVLLGLGTALSMITMYIFPDGRFYPRWTIVPAVLASAWAATWPLYPALNPYNWPAELTGPALSLCYGIAVVAMVYRYRHTSSQSQRAQMRWVMYSFALVFVAWVFAQYPLFALRSSLSTQQYSLTALLTGLVLILGQLLVTFAFAVAILRYNLWDIDIIIDRTLVYLPLTGILAGVYAASTGLLQRLFQAFTGQRSDAAVVLTTLLIVAFFAPVKDTLQRAVERRYRERRNPLAPVEALGRQVRAVVDVFDVRAITLKALQTAADALGAPGGAVFLRQNGKLQLIQSCGAWTAGGEALDMALEAGGVHLGSLRLMARGDGTRYGADDTRVLNEALVEVARAVYLANLATGMDRPAQAAWNE